MYIKTKLWRVPFYLSLFLALSLILAGSLNAQTYALTQGGGSLVRAQAVNIAVTNVGSTNVLGLVTTGIRRIFVHCVVATNSLNGFVIQGQPASAPAQVTMFSVAGDYTTPKPPLIGASGNLVTQAVGTGWFVMETTGIDLVNIQTTSSAAGGSVVSCYASGSN